MDADDLVERIYEAGMMPSLWPTLLQKIASAVGATGGLLMARTQNQERWIVSPALVPVMSEYAEQEWSGYNTRALRCRAARPHAGFRTDLDLHSHEEVATLPIYSQFLRPRRLDAGAGTMVRGTDEQDLMVTMEGFAGHDAAKSAIAALDTLRPHLARAVMISSQFRLEQAGTAIAALDVIGTGAAVLSSSGRICQANAAFQQWIGDVFTDGRRLSINDQVSDGLLVGALDSAQHGTGRSLPIRKAGLARFMLHVIPTRLSAQDVFGAHRTIAIISDPHGRAIPSTEIIQSLFELTPAEARVVRLISSNHTIGEISIMLRLSSETIRSHLKHAFVKTGVDRQAELIGMVRSLGASIPGKS